jgi:hypothetical protein
MMPVILRPITTSETESIFRLHSVRQNYFDYIQPPITEHGILIRDMLVMRYEE